MQARLRAPFQTPAFPATMRAFPDGPPLPPPGLGLVAAAEAVRRHWRLLLILPMLCTLGGVALALVLPPAYKAEAIFVAESDRNSRIPSALAGVAGQFGLALGGDASRSPQFYAAVARSRDVLESVLRTTYPAYGTAGTADSTTLLAVLAPEGDSAERVERALNLLANGTLVDVDLPTGLVRLSYTSGSPGLAADVANRFVAVIEEFNARTRRSQARQRQEFVSARRDEVQTALARAENELDAFHARNRAWESSPSLRTAEARLRRRVELQQEVFVTLSRELETARIEAVDDAPVISVIQLAHPPVYRSSPRRTLIAVMAAVLGVLLAVSWIVGWMALAQWRLLARSAATGGTEGHGHAVVAAAPGVGRGDVSDIAS